MALDLILSPHSLLSRSFTKVEISKISALFRAIESLPFLPSLQSAFAMPPTEKNGAVGVVAQPCSGTTLVVITPYGTLLLSYEGELDVTSAELVMNFTKGFTGGAPDMANISPMDNPISHDATARISELEDIEKLLYALREIAETSEDAESVRVAFISLSTTDVGQTYLKGNPIKL